MFVIITLLVISIVTQLLHYIRGGLVEAMACMTRVTTAADIPVRRGASRTTSVLYMDGQCNKLVTDDRHQFITLTVHLS